MKRREREIEEKNLHYNIIERELAVTKQKYQLTHTTAFNNVNAEAQKENHQKHETSMVIVKKMEEQTKGSDVDPTIQIKKTKSILDDSLGFVDKNQFVANNKKPKRRLKEVPFDKEAIVIIDDNPNDRMDESVEFQGIRKKVKVDR